MKFHHLTGLREIAISAVLMSVAPAMGQVSPVSVERSVRASASVMAFLSCDPGDDSESASIDGPTTFVPWDEELNLTANICDGIYWSTALAAQSSSITPAEVRVTGSVGHANTAMPNSMSFVSAMARGHFTYVFRVHVPTAYTISASSHNPVFCITYIDLNGPDGWILGGHPDPDFEFSYAGDLAPGEYSIVVESGLDYESDLPRDETSFAGSYQLVISFTPPTCPCDWNTDLAVDSADFFEFLDDFFAGEADFNFDGVTSSQDFFDFLGCFFAPPGGCV